MRAGNTQIRTKHAQNTAPKTECGCLKAGKSKTVTYAKPPRYEENERKKDFELTIYIGIKVNVVLM